MRYPNKKAKRRAEYLERKARREAKHRAVINRNKAIDSAQSIEDLAKAMNVPLGPKCFEYKR